MLRQQLEDLAINGMLHTFTKEKKTYFKIRFIRDKCKTFTHNHLGTDFTEIKTVLKCHNFYKM